MQRVRIRSLYVALGLTAVVIGCGGEAHPTVTTNMVRSGEVIQTVSAPARVDAAAREEVAAGVTGVVETVEVPDGGQVQAGQVVVRLASPQVETAREQAEAAQAALGDGRADVAIDAGGRHTIRAAHELVGALDEATRPLLAAARERAKSITGLADRTAALEVVDVAERVYQESRTALIRSSEATAAQREVLADSLSATVREAVAEASAPARAQASAAAAAVEGREEQLVVAAPFAGTVAIAQGGPSAPALPPGLPPELGSLGGALLQGSAPAGAEPLEPGAQVDAGQTLFTVYDLSTLYVTADVDEVDIPLVEVGQPTTVLVDALGDDGFAGVVEHIAMEPTSGEAGGTSYPVRVRIDTAGTVGEAASRVGDIRLGMTGRVEITTQRVTSDLVVPSRALLGRDEDRSVFIVRDGIARQVPIDITVLGDDVAAVTGDLRPGDKVVVSGAEDLQDEQRVTVR